MSLTAGTRLGPYEIQSALGAGGMGEVYRARDTRLDRTVAIKVLPADLASDPERRMRFEREARAVAALSHPNICVMHDVGRDNGVDYLVMELVDGETLAARLVRTKGPLPLDQVLKIGSEIADALDKAHRAGIVHRDLKPANVMLTKSGAKLLDFGLAKRRETVVAASVNDATTQTGGPGTAVGKLLGTVHYMAPEQVEGREADARSDIWALGVVLYEMASGTRPFDGVSAASLIGSILKDTPASLSARHPLTPPAFEHIVERCLAKEPDERWQSASDVHHELAWIRTGSSATAGPPGRVPRTPWYVAAGLAFALAALSAAWLVRPRTTATLPAALNLEITPPPRTTWGGGNATLPTVQLALSPDGLALAFVAQGEAGDSRLWLRRLEATESAALSGTEDASYPFWAPDSHAIGFFAESKLKVIDVRSGAVQTLCDVVEPRGGSWGSRDVIAFGTGQGGSNASLPLAGSPRC